MWRRLVAGRRVSCAPPALATRDLLYASLSLLGLGVLLEEFSSLALALKILDGGHLAYIGFLMWRATLRTAEQSSVTALSAKETRAYRLGFLTSLTNPKIVYGSMFTSAFSGKTAAAAEVTLPVLCSVTSLAWYGLVSFLLSQPRMRFRYIALSKILERLAGTVLVLFGLKLAVGKILAAHS